MPTLFASKKPSTAPATVPTRRAPPTPEPVRIDGRGYPGLPEFEAWQRWDVGATRHSGAENNDYIPLDGPSYPKLDVPRIVAKLAERGWRSAARPTVAGPNASTAARSAMGVHRTGVALQNPPAHPVSSLRRGLGYAMLSDWQHLKLFDQVNAVAFRGDRRSPEQIRAAGGMHPPSTRLDDAYCRLIAEAFYTFLDRRGGPVVDPMFKEFWIQDMIDYIQKAPTLEERKLFREYHFWRAIMDQEASHLLGMTDDSFMKGYVSTTRDITFATSAAGGSMGGKSGARPTSGGWLYVVKMFGGFLLKLNVGGYTKQESEIAKLGSIPWGDVVGFFYHDPMNLDADMTIYFRKVFRVAEYESFKAALAQVSIVATAGRTPK